MVKISITLLCVAILGSLSANINAIISDMNNDHNDGMEGIRIPVKRRVHEVTIDRRLKENGNLDGLEFDEVPLGVGYGTHYAEIYLGLPPQKASVIVDTGSHLTALPCSSCDDCGEHTDPLYDIKKSTTANYVTCSNYGRCNSCEDDNKKCIISQSYTEGSKWSAVVVNELCWVGSFNGTNSNYMVEHYGVRFPIGCQTMETGLFITQKENGIMGMSQDSSTIMPFLLKEGRIKKNIFSICFGGTGGAMVLGGVDYSLHTANVIYTPLIQGRSGWFTVFLEDIKVGKKSLGIKSSEYNNGRGVIVDSGTTDTFFVSQAKDAFYQIFAEMAGFQYSDSKEISISPTQFAQLPNIYLVLRSMENNGTVELTIPPSQYFTKNKDGKYSGNYHFTESSGGVLGASTMLDFNVLFDMENKRIGFAPANCESKGNSNPNISNYDLKSNSIWSKYGTVIFVALVCTFFGIGMLVLTLIWRRLTIGRWTRLNSNSNGDTSLNSTRHLTSSNDDDDDDDTNNHSAASSSTNTSKELEDGATAENKEEDTNLFTIGEISDDELSPKRSKTSPSKRKMVSSP